MHEELHPITRLQPKMFSDSFRDGGLTLDGDCGFHRCLHYIFIKVIPHSRPVRQGLPQLMQLSLATRKCALFAEFSFVGQIQRHYCHDHRLTALRTAALSPDPPAGSYRPKKGVLQGPGETLSVLPWRIGQNRHRRTDASPSTCSPLPFACRADMRPSKTAITTTGGPVSFSSGAATRPA